MTQPTEEKIEEMRQLLKEARNLTAEVVFVFNRQAGHPIYIKILDWSERYDEFRRTEGEQPIADWNRPCGGV